MTTFIAEAGVNHNGRDDIAIKLINEAHRIGADCIKFQTFKSENLATSHAPMADYQLNNTSHGSQLEMLQKLELSYKTYFKLAAHCKKIGIGFMSTAFDSESLKFLVNELKVTKLKIPSGEINNAPFVLEHARADLDMIVSTGMATLSEIESILGVIAFGYTASKNETPSNEKFIKAYSSGVGQEVLQKRVTLLHCTSAYPAPISELNLNAINTLKNTFKIPTGYSDHSLGLEASLAAVTLGASIIEKHITLDREFEGPDHKASLEPNEFEQLILKSKNIINALGSGIKSPTFSELRNIYIARKSLVAATNIKKGESFNQNNIAIQRPGGGRSPYDFWNLQSTLATKSYTKGDLIE